MCWGSEKSKLLMGKPWNRLSTRWPGPTFSLVPTNSGFYARRKPHYLAGGSHILVSYDQMSPALFLGRVQEEQ